MMPEFDELSFKLELADLLEKHNTILHHKAGMFLVSVGKNIYKVIGAETLTPKELRE